ncbi:MAG: hypothetical protein AAB467_02460 [Patescibacteria group bacterium]
MEFKFSNSKLGRAFLYITNNEETSRHEEYFDIIFFIINTFALIFGTVMFIYHDEPQWIPVLIIEYSWALDNMRHNRT